VSHGNQELPDTCEFGHIFATEDGTDYPKEIEGKEIRTLEDLEDATGSTFLKPLMGDHWRNMKVKGGQGTGFGAVLNSADAFDEMDWDVSMTGEEIFVSPQSDLHNSYMQQRQQSEQRVKETMQSLSQQVKNKHLLEHDVRKLRSRVEALDSPRDEAMIKGDFVELVDGAGGGVQGGEEASLKTLQEQNIYPSIVSDFFDMESVDDLKKADERDDDQDGALADLPANEKAILKKKYIMYEKWKDLYGSEIQRKLRELKGQLRSTKRSLDETKNWLEPYIKDMVTINDMDTQSTSDQDAGMNAYDISRGYASMERHMEYICSQGLRKDARGDLIEEDDNPTHYKIMYIHGLLVNIGDPSEPRQVGSETGVIFWHPAIVCKHVYEDIFEAKEEEAENKVDMLMQEYTGEFEPEDTKLKNARTEKELSVRQLRQKVQEELGEEVELEFSAAIRRIEDGLEGIHYIEKKYSSKHLEALETVLDTKLSEKDHGDDSGELSDFQKWVKKFTGQTDPFYLEDPKGTFSDYEFDLVFDYYIDFKKSNGLYTMK